MAHTRKRRSPLGATVTALAALAGAGLALYLYLTPLTGVTGTIGALIVVVAALLVALGAILIATTGHPVWRWLTILGIIGTAIAAAFLHGWWIVVAMIVALVGIVLDGIGPVRKEQGAAT
ncbi:hypothetical protein [Roseivivax sediminis]|uniref:Uncharacterized protein n=1 Tax=Roseivivax sediminis TaxID=936889 RepID=A0A1I2BEC7_9RHOB|nr:hypothetical protein [Roseivivax sediminis]SFE54238.1 hypothetical protein SAMN04515678_1115 [Roseivivax sediminis]